jgi:flagellar secretion chaperone FliS
MHARSAAKLYRTVQVESARPAQVLDDLYGALLTDCRRAAEAIYDGDPGAKGRHLDRALRIVGELGAALDHGRAPELCRNLTGLYAFVSSRLVRASAELNAGLVEEAERVIMTLRAAFKEAAARG